MDLEIAGNAALLTASSSGLGKASAMALASEGVNVVINGRDEDRLAAAASDIRSVATGDVVECTGDITDPDVVTALVETTVDRFGGIDHLVTSAGGPPSDPFLELSIDEWYHWYDVLVMSVVRTVHEAAEQLRGDGGGTIVTITSRTVKEAVESLVLSNAVRMSVIGLEKTLSLELAPEVRANAVMPGRVRTARTDDLIEQAMARGEFESHQEAIETWSNGIPLKRMGDTREFGALVAFLSSPRSGFVNGAAIPIDGGALGSNL